MNEGQQYGYPSQLVEFVTRFEEKGAKLCGSPPEEVASCFRSNYQIPTPMGAVDASVFVSGLKEIDVLLQPGLERQLHFRGFWLAVAFDGKHIILIEPDRPDASKIKTVIHELSEHLLAISHERHPEVREHSDKERDKWANKVAAYVKMPPERFKKQVACLGFDLELLKIECEDTLAGVARHVRDLIAKNRPFYYCRFEIERNPKRNCPKLLNVVEETGGTCIRVVDVARTASINIERRGGTLPSHNLPAFDHYKVLNPVMNRYIKNKETVFFSMLDGAASDEHTYRDLFGDQELCVLLVPYGKQKTRGYFLVAVHPHDRFYLDNILQRIQPDQHDDPGWLFSWKNDVQKRKRCKPEQAELPNLGDPSPFQFQFEEESYRWACPQMPLIA